MKHLSVLEQAISGIGEKMIIAPPGSAGILPAPETQGGRL